MKISARDGKKNQTTHLPGTSMPILHSTCFSGGLGPAFTDKGGLEVMDVLCTSERGLLPQTHRKPKTISLIFCLQMLFLISNMDKTWNLRFCLFPLINLSPLFQITHHWGPKYCAGRRILHLSPTLLPFFLMRLRQHSAHGTAAKMKKKKTPNITPNKQERHKLQRFNTKQAAWPKISHL